VSCKHTANYINIRNLLGTTIEMIKDKAFNVKNDFETEEDEDKVQQVYILLENYGSKVSHH